MSEELLNKITREIAEFSAKRKIILDTVVLFWSQITPHPDDESDIDLALVSKSFNGKSYSERINSLLGLNKNLVRLTDKAVDLIYWSEEEWTNNSGNMVIEVKEKGQVLISN